MKTNKTVRRAISLFLLVMMVASFAATSALGAEYFKAYDGTKDLSIVNALYAIGENFSYSYRAKIAAANGITGYRGTAEQNINMVYLLKEGKLIKPEVTTTAATTVTAQEGCFPVYTGNTVSIVNALYAVGANFTYSYRAKIAAANGINGYRGTAAQNLYMLDLLKAGTLKKPV